MKKFLKGINKDVEKVDQLPATYRDALNANVNFIKGAISNENGNIRIGDNFGDVVGQINLSDDSILVFAIDQNNISGILLVNTIAKTIAILYIDEALDFNVKNPIEATSKINANGEILVYFTDNAYEEITTDAYTYVNRNNPPRVFNVTAQQNYLKEPGSIPTILYGSPEYNVDKLNLFMHTGITPRIDGVQINEGGGLSTASYHLAIAYADENYNETNYMIVSNPVSIVAQAENVIPIESMIGNQRGTQTKKSITWKVRVYSETNYKYIQPAIIRVEGGAEGIEAREVFKLEPIEHPKEDKVMDITHTGIENYATSALEEIVIGRSTYLTAKTLSQSDNRLYLANVKSRPDIGYQKFANAIEVEAVTEEKSNFDPRIFDTVSLNQGYARMLKAAGTYTTPYLIFEDYITEVIRPLQEGADRGYRDANNIFKKKSFRRNEVYALYISFVLKDGTETYGYHIPGRKAKNIIPTDGLPEQSEIVNLSTLGADSENYLGATVTEILSTVPDAKAYQIYDTTLSNLENETVNIGYWENENEQYPNTDDFDIWTVDASGNPVNTGQSLRNQNVRHHKMPSNHRAEFSHVVRNVQFSNPNNYENAGNNGRVEFNETIRFLGVKIKNIRIPKEILNEVQEYRIYYAKRKDEDKTVVGSGVPAPGHPRYAVSLTPSIDVAINSSTYPAFYMKGEFATLPADTSYSLINNPQWLNTSYQKFYGFSTFKIHDFSMLRQEENVSNITHIDVQYILTCRHFRGGPHQYKSADGLVDNEGYNDLGWLHPNLSNTADPNDDDQAVRAWLTSLLFANVYSSLDQGDIDVGARINGIYHKAQWFLSDRRSVLSVDPDSKIYLPGLRNFEDSRSASFKGARYLLNAIGETAIALGLSSGLPALTGFHPSGVDFQLYLDGIDGNYFDIALGWHSNNQGYLNIYHVQNGLGDSGNYVLNDNNAYRHGKPNVYLINMCSYKTDVFKPFDRQELVWTGHSQKILNPNLDTGIVEPDSIGYNIDELELSESFNYYLGAESTNVFGGDTFITRFSVRTTSMESTWTSYQSSIPFDLDPNSGTFGYTGEFLIAAGENFLDSIFDWDPDFGTRWRSQNTTPVSSLISYICETDDNINFRHAFDTERGIDSLNAKFFDYYNAASVIFESPEKDYTKRDNLLYESHYSAVQNIKTPQPFPKKQIQIYKFPTRIIRSEISQNQISDRYRNYLALEYRDIPEESGNIWKLTELKSILYIQSELSLYVTRGREQMQIGANNVFIGSGNIFEQPPSKITEADIGVAGTTSQFAAIRTPMGYFFVSKKERKVYLLGGEGLSPISSLGMTKFFRDNIPYALEEYGLNPNLNYTDINFDAPTQYFGFVSIYDPVFERIILTKNELVPTQLFINQYTNGDIYFDEEVGAYKSVAITSVDNTPTYDNTRFFTRKGWTVSYSPNVQAWTSRHSYVPKLYTSTNKDFYSYLNGVWEHNDQANPCNFYGDLYNFEFEYIINDSPGDAKIFSSIYYWADIFTYNNKLSDYERHTTPGFTSYYVYNTTQISGRADDINYLSNARLTDRIWNINDFRDMSRTTTLVGDDLVTGIPNVQDSFTTGVEAVQNNVTMFLEEGVPNINYINVNKPWYEHKRFVDHFVGVRLICSNIDKRLINLYGAGAKYRKSYR